MKTAWIPIIGEILLIVLAILVFTILYDRFVRGLSFKESVSERLANLFFRDGLGWLVYLFGIAAVVFLVYSIFFE